VSELLAAEGITVPTLHLGLPDRFIDHGDPAMLLAQVGLDGKGIADSIEAHFGAHSGPHFGQHRAEPRVKPAA
jgi:1-deoxy-D-xylulose-5-phosphate synthase